VTCHFHAISYESKVGLMHDLQTVLNYPQKIFNGNHNSDKLKNPATTSYEELYFLSTGGSLVQLKFLFLLECHYCTISNCSAVMGHSHPWRRWNWFVVTSHIVLGQPWYLSRSYMHAHTAENLSMPKFKFAQIWLCHASRWSLPR